jgi:hypothetical protein
VRQINLTLSLTFLAPQLVKAAVEGRLPRGINIERLRDPHAQWNQQFQELGLDPHLSKALPSKARPKVGVSTAFPHTREDCDIFFDLPHEEVAEIHE